MKTSIIVIVTLGLLTGCLKQDDGPSFEKQLENDLAIIDQYLALNAIVAEVDEATGLRYVIHESGSGAQPTLEISTCVLIDYTGWLLSTELEFDAGEDKNFPLVGLIAAFQIGMPLIAEGGHITMYVPSGFAYGTRGVPQAGIPKNANLIFEVYLDAVGTVNVDTGLCD
jgi:FKBP-type peptidyl-prolyl cis-trans isomerase